MVEALEESGARRGRPFLGICVGMQLMAERGREYEVTEGLGWIAGEVDRIAPADRHLKIPHMGWNTLDGAVPHPLLDGIALGPQGLHAYFVHSYQLKPADRSDWWPRPTMAARSPPWSAATTWSARSSIRRKASGSGLELIANFLKWKP